MKFTVNFTLPNKDGCLHIRNLRKTRGRKECWKKETQEFKK